jgi:hypothetical protein
MITNAGLTYIDMHLCIDICMYIYIYTYFFYFYRQGMIKMIIDAGLADGPVAPQVNIYVYTCII